MKWPRSEDKRVEPCTEKTSLAPIWRNDSLSLRSSFCLMPPPGNIAYYSVCRRFLAVAFDVQTERWAETSSGISLERSHPVLIPTNQPPSVPLKSSTDVAVDELECKWAQTVALPLYPLWPGPSVGLDVQLAEWKTFVLHWRTLCGSDPWIFRCWLRHSTAVSKPEVNLENEERLMPPPCQRRSLPWKSRIQLHPLLLPNVGDWPPYLHAVASDQHDYTNIAILSRGLHLSDYSQYENILFGKAATSCTPCRYPPTVQKAYALEGQIQRLTTLHGFLLEPQFESIPSLDRWLWDEMHWRSWIPVLPPNSLGDTRGCWVPGKIHLWTWRAYPQVLEARWSRLFHPAVQGTVT